MFYTAKPLKVYRKINPSDSEDTLVNLPAGSPLPEADGWNGGVLDGMLRRGEITTDAPAVDARLLAPVVGGTSVADIKAAESVQTTTPPTDAAEPTNAPQAESSLDLGGNGAVVDGPVGEIAPPQKNKRNK